MRQFSIFQHFMSSFFKTTHDKLLHVLNETIDLTLKGELCLEDFVREITLLFIVQEPFEQKVKLEDLTVSNK